MATGVLQQTGQKSVLRVQAYDLDSYILFPVPKLRPKHLHAGLLDFKMYEYCMVTEHVILGLVL